MSGQWEVVGKKKERGFKKVPLQQDVKPVKKNKVNQDVNIVDVLPKSSVKNLYENGKVKENNLQQENKQSQGNSKKIPKKVSKLQEVPKAKPKSIESALNSIDVEEFEDIFKNSKNSFPEAPIVWLKYLTQFLNVKLAVEIVDPVFSNKNEEYPLNTVPIPLKTIMENALKEAGKSNVQLFFDLSLTFLATDMSKGLPGLGHKLFLQMIAFNYSDAAIENLNKHIILRNSYQNRPNIGLSILWAVGQAGIKSPQFSLKVFHELMLPVLDQKNYTKFVVNYLLNSLKRRKNIPLVKEDYVTILDEVLGNKFLLADVKYLKSLQIELKRGALLNTLEKPHILFEYYLRNLTKNSNKTYQDGLCDILVKHLQTGESCLQHWNKIYNKNLDSSAILLRYIELNWAKIYQHFNKKLLKECLESFIEFSNVLNNKKDVINTVEILKKLSNKLEKEEEKVSGFPAKSLLVFTILFFGSFIYFDINRHGSWQDSKTLFALKKVGIYEYSSQAVNKTSDGLIWIDSHLEKTFPGYQKKITEVSEPYVELLKNIGIIGCNIAQDIKGSVEERLPAIKQAIDSYAPGLYEQSQKTVSNIWSTSVVYVNRSVDYLKNEFFVGQFSPENMQKVMFETWNITSHKANECYLWLYEKIQTAIK